MPHTSGTARLRVLHIINDLERGGAEMALVRLVLHARSREHLDCTVICLGPEGVLAARLREGGIEVHALGLQKLHDLMRVLPRLWRLLDHCRPDVVQTWLYHSDLLGGLLARCRGIPLVWGVRTTSLGAGNARATRAVRWVCARLSGRLPSAIVFAADAARRAHERIGYRTTSAHVLRNGVQTRPADWLAKRRQILRTQLGLTDEHIVVGWVGRNNPDKDVPTFLQAMARILSRHSGVHVVMVGRGLGPEAHAAFASVLGQTSAARLHLMGEQDPVDACYPAFDLFVLSSRTEAFPNVLAEAMAAGMPCVSTEVGDARWVLGDGGHMVPPGNPEALASAVEALLSQPTQRESLGRLARARATGALSMEAWIDGYVKLYRGLVGQR